MKKALLVISLLLVVCSVTQAQGQTKKARIQYLFSLMHEDSMMSKMATTMASYYSKTMKNTGLDDADATAGSDSARMAKSMASVMENVKKLMAEVMITSYDKHFTSTEIEDFIRFYESKSGQKMLMETPAITNDLMMAMATKNQDLIKKVMEGQ